MNRIATMMEPPAKVLRGTRASSIEKQPHINDLPIEILTEIFKLSVESDGASVLFLLSDVCNLWKQITMSCNMWTIIDDQRITKKQLFWLIKKKFLSHTTTLNLRFIANCLTIEELRVISTVCPGLRSLDLSTVCDYRRAVQTFVDNCPKIHCLTLRRLEKNISVNSLELICASLPNLMHLNLSNNCITNVSHAMRKIAECCPNLTELYMNSISGTNIVFPVGLFMKMCPNMIVISLECFDINVNGCPNSGFPKLESFSCSTITELHLLDKELKETLKCSPKLKTLDVRGTRVSGLGLFDLNVPNLQSLSIARTPAIACRRLSDALAKWRHSLKYLDISRFIRIPSTMQALINFISGEEVPVLERLDLSYSSTTVDFVKEIILKCPKLYYLNLEGCRELPRGKKQIYHTALEIKNIFKSSTRKRSYEDIYFD